jgi:hypothetical protein
MVKSSTSRGVPESLTKTLQVLSALLGGLEGVAVAARHRPDAAADVVVDVIGQVGQRDAQRPVGRLEAAAVQQHDPVGRGQTEGQVQRVELGHPVRFEVSGRAGDDDLDDRDRRNRQEHPGGPNRMPPPTTPITTTIG